MPDWVKRRTVVLLTAALLLVVAAVVIFVYAATSGPGGGPSGPAPGSNVVLTVEQALAAEKGQKLNVEGAILATGGQTVLASALAESEPPQAVGVTLPVKGLDLAALVGLSSTVGQAGMAEVTWSDYSVVLQGVIKSGALQVATVPAVIEDTSLENVKVRFSSVSEPINSGDQVWWVFDVTNTGPAPLDLVFPNGQRGDVILTQGDVDKYAWSDGKAFTQVVETVTLAPGKSLSIVLNDTLAVPPGSYDLAARVTAVIGPSDSGVPPPDILATLTVH